MSFLFLLALAASASPQTLPDQDKQVISNYDQLSDEELSALRGGFRLPNGVDVALTVQSQTAIDGATVLRTVFRADQGTPQFAIFVPKSGEKVAAPGSDRVSMASSSSGLNIPIVSYDSRSGVHIVQTQSAPTVSVTSGMSESSSLTGLEQVSADGQGVVTDSGFVSQSSQNGLLRAQLQSPDITIQHLAGNAFGSAVANSGSDRMIDTQTSVNIELGNVGALLSQSAALRVDNIISDALRNRN